MYGGLHSIDCSLNHCTQIFIETTFFENNGAKLAIKWTMKIFNKQICLQMYCSGLTFDAISLQKLLKISSGKLCSVVTNDNFQTRIMTEPSMIQLSCCMLGTYVKHNCKLRPTGKCVTNCEQLILLLDDLPHNFVVVLSKDCYNQHG